MNVCCTERVQPIFERVLCVIVFVFVNVFVVQDGSSLYLNEYCVLLYLYL